MNDPSQTTEVDAIRALLEKVAIFSLDQAANDYARESVVGTIAKLRRIAAKTSGPKGDGYRAAARIVESELIGGTGCVVAAFDVRRPSIRAEMLKTCEADES